jgi:opine dehydrogenase
MPSGVESRYLTEDIPMSLMPIAALAEQVGAPARTMRATIAFTEGVLGRELAGEARTLTELGLDGLTPVEILARV